MSRAAWIAVGLAALVTISVGCTGGEADRDKPEKASTSTLLPPECDDVVAPADEKGKPNPSTTTTLPPNCADAVFVQVVTDEGSDELKEIDGDRLLGFGRGLCAYGATLAADPKVAPTYDELVESTSKSWEVSTNSVEEVLGFAATLCPGDLDPILKLRDDVGAVTVEMAVSGQGKLHVTYVSPDGGSIQDDVTAPWVHEVVLDPVTDFRLVATSEGGNVTCAISVKDTEVTKTSADKKGSEAVCEAPASELRAAAR